MNVKVNERIAIVNGFRTPLKVGTMFRGIDADELGVYPLKESFLRSNVSPKDIDEVIGCCGQPVHVIMLVELLRFVLEY